MLFSLRNHRRELLCSEGDPHDVLTHGGENPLADSCFSAVASSLALPPSLACAEGSEDRQYQLVAFVACFTSCDGNVHADVEEGRLDPFGAIGRQRLNLGELRQRVSQLLLNGFWHQLEVCIVFTKVSFRTTGPNLERTRAASE